MKLNYTKPGITFQNIALANDVSPGCKFKSNFAFGTCPVIVDDEDEAETVFAAKPDCKYKPDGYFCYDVPLAASTIIDS